MAAPSSMREEACLLTSWSRAPPPATSNSTLLPGVMPKASRIRFGIVTWPLLVTDTAIGNSRVIPSKNSTKHSAKAVGSAAAIPCASDPVGDVKGRRTFVRALQSDGLKIRRSPQLGSCIESRKGADGGAVWVYLCYVLATVLRRC